LFLLTAGGCVAAAVSLNRSFGGDGGFGRRHLEPIPVSPKVCPYVRVMHAAANDFQRVNPIADIFRGPARNEVAWPVRRARLEQSLDVLELGIVVSRPHFPARIRKRLGVVLTSIRSARPKVDRADDEWELLGRTVDVFQRGQYAFGDASDLVGDACAVRLAADPL
jgi:hypothetical protein